MHMQCTLNGIVEHNILFSHAALTTSMESSQSLRMKTSSLRTFRGRGYGHLKLSLYLNNLWPLSQLSTTRKVQAYKQNIAYVDFSSQFQHTPFAADGAVIR